MTLNSRSHALMNQRHDSGATSPGAVSESRRLAALVRDMLEMSKIEAGALGLDVEPLRLGDAIEAAAERLRLRSPEREVRWSRSRQYLRSGE